MKFSEMWDKEVKPLAQDVVLTCKTDPYVSYYVSQMIFYIEHDLADSRDPRIRLEPCMGTLNDVGYYNDVYHDSSVTEVGKLSILGKALRRLMEAD